MPPLETRSQHHFPLPKTTLPYAVVWNYRRPLLAITYHHQPPSIPFRIAFVLRVLRLGRLTSVRVHTTRASFWPRPCRHERLGVPPLWGSHHSRRNVQTINDTHGCIRLTTKGRWGKPCAS